MVVTVKMNIVPTAEELKQKTKILKKENSGRN
jgi:hypothetical protein